jgi:hypothetical protein
MGQRKIMENIKYFNPMKEMLHVKTFGKQQIELRVQS